MKKFSIKKFSIKKFMSAGLIILLFMTLTGCGNSTDTSSPSDSSEDTVSVRSQQEVGTVYAATGGSPKPFVYVDDDGELTGHNIELITAVFEKLPQYELVIEKTDFPSIFAGLDSDRYQIGVNNFAMNDERKEKYLFSDPIFKNQYVVIAASNNDSLDNVEGLADLAGHNFVGQTAINSTTAVENYNTENPDNQIKITYTEEDLVVQLQNIETGKYEFLIMDKPMYESYNKEYNFDLKEIELSSEMSPDLTDLYSYFIISKDNEQLLEDINIALEEVIRDGTSKEINEKYFGEDYTPYKE